MFSLPALVACFSLQPRDFLFLLRLFIELFSRCLHESNMATDNNGYHFIINCGSVFSLFSSFFANQRTVFIGHTIYKNLFLSWNGLLVFFSTIQFVNLWLNTHISLFLPFFPSVLFLLPFFFVLIELTFYIWGWITSYLLIFYSFFSIYTFSYCRCIDLFSFIFFWNPWCRRGKPCQ